jgi:hypothetical protein
MSEVSGKAISFHDETEEEAWSSRREATGAPDWEIEGWVASYLAVARGEIDVVSDAVRRVTGRDPVTLAEYVRAPPESLAHVDP